MSYVTGDTKKPWQSKTLWVNLIMAVLSFFPAVKDTMQPEYLAAVFAVVNFVLRYVTKSPIQISN